MNPYQALAEVLLETHSDEAALVLEAMPDEEALPILAEASAKVAARVLRSMAPLPAASLLTSLGREHAVEILESLEPEVAANLMRRMQGDARTSLVESLSGSQARFVRALLDYPEGTAGSLMDPGCLVLPRDLTVQEANRIVREAPENVRYNLYVLDRDDKLVGVLNLRELFLAKRGAAIAEISNPKVLSIRAGADLRAVLDHPVWMEAHSLPVVDDKDVYLGAIRYRTFRRLEERLRRKEREGWDVTTRAFGELFSTGLVGAFGALAAAAAKPIGQDTEHEAQR